MLVLIFTTWLTQGSLLVLFSNGYPASIATLAQRWPNVNPYVGPTSAHQRWANVDLSIGPTLAQRLHANVGPTLCQHRPNVGTLMLRQRWHNVMPMVVCQRCTNIGPTEAALLAFCEGNPSVSDRSLPALGRFRRKVVLANYGVKKKTTREHVLGRRWVDIGRAMSTQRRFDVGLITPADVGQTSVRRQSQYF